jgi:hypothetical protein
MQPAPPILRRLKWQAMMPAHTAARRAVGRCGPPCYTMHRLPPSIAQGDKHSKQAARRSPQRIVEQPTSHTGISDQRPG